MSARTFLPRLALAASLCAAPPFARAAKPTLQFLPAEKLSAMAGLLRHGDVALVESMPTGRLKQVTLMTLVNASPSSVREIVKDLAKYPEFVSNVSESKVTKNADGTVDQSFAIRYTLFTISGVTRYHFLPDGAIEFEATDADDNGRFRWEFLAAPGGGTVLVFYGYTDVLHSNDLIRSAVKRMPALEHGLAVAAQLVQLRGMKLRAESTARLAPGASPAAPAPPSPGFGFLLDRGSVAVLRHAATGHLADLSVVERLPVTRDKVEAAILDPSGYAGAMHALARSQEVSRGADGIAYTAKIDLPIASWESRYLLHPDGKHGIDELVTDGDLKGAQYRWDLSLAGPSATLAVLRGRQDLAASSIVLRALFRQEPLFEHGFAVGLGLDTMGGIRARAEAKR